MHEFSFTVQIHVLSTADKLAIDLNVNRSFPSLTVGMQWTDDLSRVYSAFHIINHDDLSTAQSSYSHRMDLFGFVASIRAMLFPTLHAYSRQILFR